MTRRIKRIAAVIIAGILLVCVSFASFAEDAEGILDVYENNAEAIQDETVISETAEAEAESEEDEIEEKEPAEETEAVQNEEETEESAENAVEEETEEQASIEPTEEETEEQASEDPAEEETTETEEVEESIGDEAEEETEEQISEDTEEEVTVETEEAEEAYYEFTEADDTEYEELSDDAGYIDQAVVQQFIPEVTEELIANSEKYTADEAEDENKTEEETPPSVIRAWITTEAEEVFIGDVLKLKANTVPELNGDVTWEIRNDQWEKDVWNQTGTGKELTLNVTAENADDLVRFIMADGTVSEVFRIHAAERTEEADADTAEEGAETAADEGSESTEGTDIETNTDEEENRPESDVAEILNNDANADTTSVTASEEAIDEDTENETDDEISEEAAEITEDELTGETTGEAAEETVNEEAADETAEAGEETNSEIIDENSEEITEETSEEINEEIAEETIAETEDPSDAEEANEAATDDTAEDEAEVAVIRAWITASSESAEIGDSIVLTANADPELNGVSTWQIWDEANEKWQKIGYGDTVTVEVMEENAEGIYRFIMQDGTVSETWQMQVNAPAEEIVPDAEDPKETEVQNEPEAEMPVELPDEEKTPDAIEEPEDVPVPELPEDRSVNVTMTWDDENPSLGSVAHFQAELKGYDGFDYQLQWLESADNENWTEVEGATADWMDVVVTEDNYNHFWRVEVRVITPEETAL